MKRYPLLSILLIIVFFALLATALVCLSPERKAKLKKEEAKKIEEQQETIPEAVPETVSEAVPKIDVQEKKAQFKAVIIPAVNEVYTDLMRQYQEVAESIQTGTENDQFSELRKKFKAASNEELLMALKPHPKSVAIAQAAIESSWGTSRFFKEANNVFGVWSFNKNEPRIAAEKKRDGRTVWVKKYDSIEASIRDYYRTLARGDAFREFRALKMETDDPYELVKKLDHYSEKREKYSEELTVIIRFNKFDAYDQQKITL